MKLFLSERHPNLDFFIADIFDSSKSFKDDVASMEHPVFSLSTKPDMRVLKYEHNGHILSIFPSGLGLATIFDKDVLLYCGSLMMDKLNNGEVPPQRIRISAYDLLVSTNRQTSGEGYKLLHRALIRLKGTIIETNIKTKNEEAKKGFGLIDEYEIVKKSRDGKRMVQLEIKLSDWFYNAILGREMLTISRDYFRLRKPTDRRLYELARKHCGKQKKWTVSLETLHKKLGTTSSLKLFRNRTKEGLIEHNHLPDYRVSMKGDVVTFTNRKPQKSHTTKKKSSDSYSLKLRQDTYEKAKKAAPGYDVYALEQEWRDFWEKSGSPKLKNSDAAFIGFCKKRHERRPCR